MRMYRYVRKYDYIDIYRAIEEYNDPLIFAKKRRTGVWVIIIYVTLVIKIRTFERAEEEIVYYLVNDNDNYYAWLINHTYKVLKYK